MRLTYGTHFPPRAPSANILNLARPSCRRYAVCMMRIAALAFLLLALPVLPARAERDTVQTLYRQCATTAPETDQVYCFGYISGAGDVLLWNGVMAQVDIKQRSAVGNACPGDMIKLGAMVQVFRDWVVKHPEKRSLPAMIGVVTAIREAWPCP